MEDENYKFFYESIVSENIGNVVIINLIHKMFYFILFIKLRNYQISNEGGKYS